MRSAIVGTARRLEGGGHGFAAPVSSPETLLVDGKLFDGKASELGLDEGDCRRSAHGSPQPVSVQPSEGSSGRVPRVRHGGSARADPRHAAAALWGVWSTGTPSG